MAMWNELERGLSSIPVQNRQSLQTHQSTIGMPKDMSKRDAVDSKGQILLQARVILI
jgi:hypothetical protein